MRTLYEQYFDSTIILPPLVAEIPWTHNILILEKSKDEHERFYSINMTKKISMVKNITYQCNRKSILTKNISTFHPTNDDFVNKVESITNYIQKHISKKP